MADKKNLNYISEPALNSELVLFNNSKLLKEDNSLFNDIYIDEIQELRKQYEILDYSNDKGLQKQKRELRNKIRELSMITYVDRDGDIFGSYILLVINRLLTSNRFSGYSYKDDMRSLAIGYILLYTHKFDSSRQSEISGQHVSAFAYLTTIAFNAAIATINSHKKEETKAKEDFVETQRLFHRDPNISTYEDDYSTPNFEVTLNSIPGTLLEELMKFPETYHEVLVKYSADYRISVDEYHKITDYTKKNNIILSLVRLEEM